MDATGFGSLLVGAGAVAGAAVAFLGKRGETALNGYSSLTDNLQEERDRLDRQLIERDSKLAAQADEITRLRQIIIHLGGTP